MGNKLKFMFQCDEATHICDKTQYKESSFLEKFKLQLHLIYCKTCRKYSRNNFKLTDCIEKSNIQSLDKKFKESMKEKLDAAIKEVSN
ncbi:glycine dehydrogenase [Siansivirga zeaxanthinifaciens CC-SAMT-1]|uniref:Glycine dehydrogenase n=1 Tax=Siansivirga zeaxanthinifaciens CC-SAMT-1 TaxID=1454006 RepID=A0A0C5W888_9FLAO|nr:glycine dehydrogenase [Siansivirga zeaxanthinifaciens CC-SAMT-1]